MKKGLLGAISFAIIIVLLIAGFFLYLQVKKNGLQISSGNIVLDIKYNESQNDSILSGKPLPEVVINNVTLNPKNSTNSTQNTSKK